MRIPLELPASVKRLLPALADDWTLAEYVVGPENEGLRYLFDDASVNHLATLSPVVLYGDQHLGKTALAITLAVRWSRQVELRPICFTSGQSFASDFAESIEIDDVASFRKRHRECKLLVIDDLDSLASKPAAQDELSATIDHLLDNSRPMIATLGRLPAAVKSFKPALASRLSAGYSFGFAKPAAETRAELVRLLIQAIDPSLPEDPLINLTEQLAANTPLVAPDLRAIVTIAHHQFSQAAVLDLPLVASLARQQLSNDAPNIPLIAKRVAKKLGIKWLDLRGSTRDAAVVRARGLAMLLSREFTSASLQSIGQFFSGRDHSTVLHACRKTTRLLDSDPALANVYRDLKNELLNHRS